jgi:hypothetical protein
MSSRASSTAGPSSRQPSPTRSSTEDAQKPSRSEYTAYNLLLRELSAQHEPGLAEWLALAKTQRASSFNPDIPPSRQSTVVPSPASRHPADLEALSTRWPLSPDELSAPPADLQEAILDFTQAYIREHRLVLPRVAVSKDVTIPAILPPRLVLSSVEMVNEVLVGLAGMRPPETAARRRSKAGLGWQGVVGSAAVISSSKE